MTPFDPSSTPPEGTKGPSDMATRSKLTCSGFAGPLQESGFVGPLFAGSLLSLLVVSLPEFLDFTNFTLPIYTGPF